MHMTKNELKKSVEIRFFGKKLNILRNNLYLASTYLDPRFKASFFDQVSKAQVEDYILSELTPGYINEDTKLPEDNNAMACSYLFDQCFNELQERCRNVPKTSFTDVIEKELEFYSKLLLCNKNDNPLGFWK